jgi:hypothetical protein
LKVNKYLCGSGEPLLKSKRKRGGKMLLQQNSKASAHKPPRNSLTPQKPQQRVYAAIHASKN